MTDLTFEDLKKRFPDVDEDHLEAALRDMKQAERDGGERSPLTDESRGGDT